MDCKEAAVEQINQGFVIYCVFQIRFFKIRLVETGESKKCSEKSMSEKIEEIYREEGLPESDAGSEETIADLGKTDDNNELDEMCEPAKKKMRLEITKLQKEMKAYYVHVERPLRERAFNSLVKQRFSIQIVQCDICRANRTHLIVQNYGSDWLVVMNLCEKCLQTNMEIGKLHNTFWPKYEQLELCRINHQLPSDGIIFFYFNFFIQKLRNIRN